MSTRDEPDYKAAFGQAVRKLRHELGMSQEELAELASIHRTYVGDIERGKRNISLHNMLRLSTAFNVPLSRLIQEMEAHSGK